MDSIRTGSFIASLRREKGMTQKELASLLGVSDKAVSKWERGESYPEVTLFPALGAVLGVTADELMAGERQPQTPTEAPEPIRVPEQSLYPLLMDNVREKAARSALLAWLLAVLAFVVKYAFSGNSLSEGALFPWLAPGAAALLGIAGAVLLFLASGQFSASRRQYRAMSGLTDSRTLSPYLLLFALTALFLLSSLTLDAMAGSSVFNSKGENLFVLKSSTINLSIVFACVLSAANLAIRRWGDRQPDRPDRLEMAVTLLTTLVTVAATLLLIRFLWDAVEQGLYQRPPLPDLGEDTPQFGSYDYLKYLVSGLQYGLPGVAPTLFGGIGVCVLLNLFWMIRRRDLRSAVCGLANLAIPGLVLGCFDFWFRLAPFYGVWDAAWNPTGSTTLLFVVVIGLFDLLLAAALTIRHLAGTAVPVRQHTDDN
ncbi:helix-turn-helix transcriptional regulator [Pseudoflavonifractor sp. CLA-AP-H29]|uniref:Helix-turn-helix transcriptional regulator n=1 Tax=Pseudoflavonifractor intestinihominis TaxID=3133171 RepID=A0ABV1E7Y9_9FIRM